MCGRGATFQDQPQLFLAVWGLGFQGLVLGLGFRVWGFFYFGSLGVGGFSSEGSKEEHPRGS